MKLQKGTFTSLFSTIYLQFHFHEQTEQQIKYKLGEQMVAYYQLAGWLLGWWVYTIPSGTVDWVNLITFPTFAGDYAAWWIGFLSHPPVVNIVEQQEQQGFIHLFDGYMNAYRFVSHQTAPSYMASYEINFICN